MESRYSIQRCLSFALGTIWWRHTSGNTVDWTCLFQCKISIEWTVSTPPAVPNFSHCPVDFRISSDRWECTRNFFSSIRHDSFWADRQFGNQTTFSIQSPIRRIAPILPARCWLWASSPTQPNNLQSELNELGNPKSKWSRKLTRFLHVAWNVC